MALEVRSIPKRLQKNCCTFNPMYLEATTGKRGPVPNKEGILLGIIARSDKHMNALAIPARYTYQLLSEMIAPKFRLRRLNRV